MVQLLVFITLESDVASSVLGKHLIIGPAGKGADSKKEDVEDEPQAEHVADGFVLGLHILDVDDLGGDVAGGAASYEQVLLGVGELGQSKIGDDALSPVII